MVERESRGQPTWFWDALGLKSMGVLVDVPLNSLKLTQIYTIFNNPFTGGLGVFAPGGRPSLRLRLSANHRQIPTSMLLWVQSFYLRPRGFRVIRSFRLGPLEVSSAQDRHLWKLQSMANGKISYFRYVRCFNTSTIPQPYKAKGIIERPQFFEKVHPVFFLSIEQIPTGEEFFLVVHRSIRTGPSKADFSRKPMCIWKSNPHLGGPLHLGFDVQ